jgi:hypothetical protein
MFFENHETFCTTAHLQHIASYLQHSNCITTQNSSYQSHIFPVSNHVCLFAVSFLDIAGFTLAVSENNMKDFSGDKP